MDKIIFAEIENISLWNVDKVIIIHRDLQKFT